MNIALGCSEPSRRYYRATVGLIESAPLALLRDTEWWLQIADALDMGGEPSAWWLMNMQHEART